MTPQKTLRSEAKSLAMKQENDMLFVFVACVNARDGLIKGHEHLRSLASEYVSRPSNYLKKDGSPFLFEDFELFDDEYSDNVTNKSSTEKMFYTLERKFLFKEYVSARLLESVTIQGFYDSEVRFPIVMNVADTGNYVANTNKNTQYFMCAILRVYDFVKLFDKGEIKTRSTHAKNN